GAGAWMASCPAHDDSKASLSITTGNDQPVVMACMAGCQTADVLAALNLTFADISAQRQGGWTAQSEWTPRGAAVAVYDYVDESGELLFQVLRTADKQFSERRPDPSAPKGWRWRLGDVRRVPYRLPRVIQAVGEHQPVWIAEGEKDVQALEVAGAVATCNPG